MAKQPTHNRRPWTVKDLQQLHDLAERNTPTRLIADKLDRSPDAVRAKASVEKISLAPWNQSPYNRRNE